MKITKHSEFRDGQRVSCEIEGFKIEVARVRIEENGTVYLLQNHKSGGGIPQKGFMFSWGVSTEYTEYERSNRGVTNIVTLGHTDLRGLCVGDYLLDDDDDKRRVLGVAGEMVFYSDYEDNSYDWETVEGGSNTYQGMERRGWRLAISEDPVTELTMDEIAKKFGKDVKAIRIKKDEE